MQTSAKCCCCRCSKSCINIGSLGSDCGDCGELPDFYQVSGFCGGLGSGSYFACCGSPTAGGGSFENVVHLLIGGYETGNACVFRSFTSSCSPLSATTAQWEFDVTSACSSGNPRLKLGWGDGAAAYWELLPSMRGTWSPRCSIILARQRHLDVAGSVITDPRLCSLPPRLCLTPLDPCCWERELPLPRSLTLTTSATMGTVCGCSEGATIPLAWDNSVKKWVSGSVSFGSCGGSIEVEVWCQRLVPGSANSFFARFRITSTTNVSCNTNGGSPPTPQWVDFDETDWQVKECDPLHIRWQYSLPGCCGATISMTRFDLTE